jgi:hypothetical protein
VLKVNVAKPLKMGEKSRAVWNVDRDEYEIGKEGSGGSGAPDDEKPTDGEAASKP